MKNVRAFNLYVDQFKKINNSNNELKEWEKTFLSLFAWPDES